MVIFISTFSILKAIKQYYRILKELLHKLKYYIILLANAYNLELWLNCSVKFIV